MATAALPDLLQSKLADLAARLRWLRLLRGVSWFVLALVGGAALSMSLDYWLELGPTVRIAVFACWLGSIGLAVWRGLLRPLRRPLTAATLAAVVEEEFPRLRERLTTSVELSERTDEYHGSQLFVRLLVHETDLKTRALDFHRAAPPQTAEWSAIGAVAALLLLGALAAIWSDSALGLGRRLLMPWDRRPAVLPFAMTVTPGDTYVAIGRPLTIAVELTPKEDGVALPATCTLVLAPADGKSMRLRMSLGDRPHTFSYRIDDIKGDHRYWVEVGMGQSDTHTITAVDPVELDVGFPVVTLTPPAYAKSLPLERIEGLADLTVLQYGRVAIACRFTRPATDATLVWTTTSPPKSESIPLQLSEDRLSARGEMAARDSGSIQLKLGAGHGVLTIPPAQALNVIVDRPPEFRRVGGLPEKAEARPTDTVSLSLAIADDLAVASADLEYRVGDGEVQCVPLALTGFGNTLATGSYTYSLDDKAKEGDVLRIRFRAIDTRSVPEADLFPNVTYFPPGDRWAELRIVSEADPLRQQEVNAKRDQFEKRLRDVIDQLAQNQRQQYRLHQELTRRQFDATEHGETLKQLTEANDGMSRKLNELSRDAATAGLAPLADKSRAVADDEVRQAGEALRDAEIQSGQSRVAPLRRAEAATIQAREKLEALVKENGELAKSQLDEAKLRDLAEREREMADKVNKANSAEERAKLADEQKKLAEQLKNLGEGNEALREALRAAQAEQARHLAEQAAELAKTERAIDEKLREAERQLNAERLAGVAGRQQQLADVATRLANETQGPAESARVPAFNPADAAKAAESLRRGEADDAMSQQERTARDLDKLANDLQRLLDLNNDPREGARQLMRMQEETRKRPQGTAEQREARRREEELLRQAIERLPIPSDNVTAQRERREAADQAAQSAQKLEQNNPRAAADRMEASRDALNRLSLSLPTAEQRLRQARDEAARLRKQQDDLAQQTERAVRMTERNDPVMRQRAADELADAERKQAEVAERLAKLDAPGQENRRDDAQRAAAQALQDLMNHRTVDVQTSQNGARRAVDRLQDALAGKVPADKQARDLANQQGQLADDIGKSATNLNKKTDLQRRQEQIVRDAQNVNPTEASVRQGEAVQAALQANRAIRERPNDPSTSDKVREAADKLKQWADQLARGEDNAERADRLARQQEATAREPRANPVESATKTNQLADEVKQVRSDGKADAEKQQAGDALARLQHTPSNSAGHAEAQQAAAQALRQFADRLAEKKKHSANAETQSPVSPEDLSRQQLDLANQTEAARRQSGADQRLALERVASEQLRLQEHASQLSAEPAPQAIQQARQAMERAAKALGRNDAGQAAQQQQNAATSLEQAARQSARAAADAARRADQQNGIGQPNADHVARARDLSNQQRALREQVQQVLGQPPDRPLGDAASQTQQQQLEVAQQAGELARKLGEAATRMPNEPARTAGQDAARSAQRAEDSLRQAQDSNGGQVPTARRQAIDALDRAAQRAEQSARTVDSGRRQPSPNGQPSPAKAGQAVQQAQGQMNQAQNQLTDGQNQDAQRSMRQAAQSLDQAAQRIGQRNQNDGQRDANERTEANGPPATGVSPGVGDPRAGNLPSHLQKYVGKNWGELPGELRTGILQDVKAHYGEDYARIIKLYFEQIADNPRK